MDASTIALVRDEPYWRFGVCTPHAQENGCPAELLAGSAISPLSARPMWRDLVPGDIIVRVAVGHTYEWKIAGLPKEYARISGWKMWFTTQIRDGELQPSREVVADPTKRVADTIMTFSHIIPSSKRSSQ
ncbi:hypothetical protein OG339_48380 (plasmid) [Streptosporangium sp. NBC_01495]|uniref:hypothetical protein n=1 Tax=Streptosporangium sp. NBC_01495 TaxID=2903899 RepID=UPI002E311F6F|nr:hypothetical protein [Streptosporangium sp. NBC_01495]